MKYRIVVVILSLYTALVHPARAQKSPAFDLAVHAFEGAREHYSPAALQKSIALAENAADGDSVAITLLRGKALYYSAFSYYLNGQKETCRAALDKAMDVLNQAIADSPQSLEAVAYRIAARALLEHFEGVSIGDQVVIEADWKIIHKAPEENPFVLYAQAMPLFYKATEADAIEETKTKAARLFRQLAKIDPQNTEYRAFALYFLGLTDKDKKPAATASLTHMIENNKEDRLALFLRQRLDH